MPMGELLHRVSDILYISMFTVIISVTGGNLVYGQLKLENLQPFELEISDISDLSNKNYWRLAPSDRELISLFGVSDIRNESDTEGHFSIERTEGRYLGVRPSGRQDQDLLRFRLSNDTGKMIDRIQVKLDLAFLAAGELPSELYISYTHHSVSGGERLLQSNQFRNANEWQPASLNTQIENMLLGPDETVDIKILIRGGQGEGLADAVALRRLEIVPDEFERNLQLSVGDLIITEIFPGAVTRGEELYYIEIYNSTNKSIDLRGLDLKSGNNIFKIRSPLKIESYQTVLLANRSINQIGFNPDYIISDFRLPSHGGLIELIENGHKIMRAAFDAQRSSRSWELRRVVDVLDGYTAMADFEESESFFSADLYGSPGEKGITERAFTYVPEGGPDWKMISAPGVFSVNMNRENGYWTGADNYQDGAAVQIPRGSGLLKSGAAGQQWIVRESDPGSAVRLRLPEENNKWLLLGNPFLEPIQLEQIRPLNGNFSNHPVQIWDEDRQTFSVLNPGGLINPWQAFIVQNNDAKEVVFENELILNSQQRLKLEARNRFIAFGIESGDPRRGRISDHAARLYFHELADHGHDAFESEKLWPVFQDADDIKTSMIYFIGQKDGRNSFLAQDSRPFDIENQFEVKLGHIAYNVSGPHTLSWNQFENIPDDWSLKLTDLHTGNTVDMRDNHHLTFDVTPELRILPEFSEDPRLYPLQGSETFERFLITINPASNQAASERNNLSGPDRVELYQNFPNPFNPATNIRFYLPEQRPVVVGVYNVVGQRVAQLKDEVLPQGEHTVAWDATDMPSGIYIIHLEIGNQVLTRKMTLIK